MVSSGSYVPELGDIMHASFDPHAGHEQAGNRPALILSSGGFNAKTKLALMCPITSTVRGYSFEVCLPSGVPVAGVILVDQIKSFDWRARNATFICKASSDTLKEVMRKLFAMMPLSSLILKSMPISEIEASPFFAPIRDKWLKEGMQQGEVRTRRDIRDRLLACGIDSDLIDKHIL